MKYGYITFRSLTYAQRGEKLLGDSAVRCTLQRTPRWMEEQGCGYSLRLWAKDIDRGTALLRKAGIPLRKVYIQREDGQLEEVNR